MYSYLPAPLLGLHVGVSVAMIFGCHSCGCQVPILRLNGSPKEFQCPGCSAIYRVSVERIGPPKTLARIVRGSEYVKAGA